MTAAVWGGHIVVPLVVAIAAALTYTWVGLEARAERRDRDARTIATFARAVGALRAAWERRTTRRDNPWH